MKALFSPAIALMNRLRFTRKFALLWLMSLAAFLVVVASLYDRLDDEIENSRKELEGLVLVDPITHALQAIQRHRGLSAVLLGDGATRDKLIIEENESSRFLRATDEKLPPVLRETKDWKDIKAGWEHLRKEGSGMTAQDNFAEHTRLTEQILFFELAVADEYALTLDSQIDIYYLIDIAVNRLPFALDHIGQLRALGAGILSRKQISEAQHAEIHEIIGMLKDALAAAEINLAKTGRHNPALRDSFAKTSSSIMDSARRVIGIIESDILSGRFTLSPDEFFANSTSAIDWSYWQIHESLLPATRALIEARLARAKKELYTSIGVALLLILVVGYFAMGIYHSIAGNVRSLGRSARLIARGDLRERIHLDTRDELMQIGDSFNEMANGFNALLAARKQAEKEMLESETKFRTLYESSSDAIMLLDKNGFIDCNEATLRVFGCPAHDDFINKHPSQLSPSTQPGGQDSMSLANEHIAAAFRDGSNQFEWMHCRLDGTEFPAEVSLTSMELNGRQLLQATVRDITERAKAVENLRRFNEELKSINQQLENTQNVLLQSEKMASIGQLAAGVAHEINNPIGYVYSNLSTLEKYVQDMFGIVDAYERAEGAISDESVRARLKAAREKLDIDFLKEDLRALMNESKDGITRVKKIVQSLKDFSHVDASDEWHFADLRKGLDSTLNIIDNEIKYKADVISEYGDLPEIECLPSQLNQVFMNLLVNAAHAIEERGTITIRTGQQDGEVWVEIADTGKGIAPEHLKKIFDPFFTTKPIGKGTGLGLSLSYGIVRKHHGRIEVQSEVGRGTTFRVWLPVKQPQDDA